MQSFAVRAARAALVLLVACSCSGKDKGPSDSGLPPDPETLFEDLAPATPNTLRGVWQSTRSENNGTTELRLRFMDKYLVGAAMCFKDGADLGVLAGDTTDLEASSLDAATGTVTIGALGFQKEDGIVSCVGGMPAATYSFAIVEDALTLTTNGVRLPTLTKIGD